MKGHIYGIILILSFILINEHTASAQSGDPDFESYDEYIGRPKYYPVFYNDYLLKQRAPDAQPKEPSINFKHRIGITLSPSFYLFSQDQRLFLNTNYELKIKEKFTWETSVLFGIPTMEDENRVLTFHHLFLSGLSRNFQIKKHELSAGIQAGVSFSLLNENLIDIDFNPINVQPAFSIALAYRYPILKHWEIYLQNKFSFSQHNEIMFVNAAAYHLLSGISFRW